MKYRSQTDEIEAIQYDGSNEAEIVDWMKVLDGGKRTYEATVVRSPGIHSLRITMDGNFVEAEVGDFVARGEGGYYMTWEPDVFATIFKPAE